MATPKETIWPAEPHTLAKHEILRQYLSRWMNIIAQKFGRMIYFDGFSGPGVYTGGEPGSPMIAVEVASAVRPPVERIKLVFCEVDPDRKQRLDSQLDMIALPSYCEVETHCSSFEAVAKDLLASYNKANQPATFTLIDPFGFSGIPYRAVQSLMQRNRSECLVTFMVDAMNRWLEHPKEEVRRHIVDAFGTEKVLDIVDSPGTNRIQALRELYLEQLSALAKYCRYFEMRDRDNRILYYLYFISDNTLGFLKMKEAMWEVDKTGCFRYSDSTNPDQRILFTVEHTWLPVLKKQIEDEFQNRKRVNIDEVKVYVDEKTMFLDKHMKAVMRTLEDESRISPYPMKSDGKQRRKGTFPDGVVVDFL